jgi:hypothetical protein
MARFARRRRAVVAEHAAREADQDRREDHPSGRYVIFEMAEVAVPRTLFADIPRRIDCLRPTPALA